MENNMNGNEIEDQDQSQKLMELWSNFLRTLSTNKQEDVENVFGNLLDLLKEIEAKEVFVKEEFESESEKYFFTSFCTEMIKNVLQANTRNQTVRELILETLQFLLKYFAVSMKNPKLLLLIESLAHVFNEEQSFYKSCDGKDASEIFLERIYGAINPDGYEWRNGLVVGSQVDYLVRDSMNSDSSLYKSIGVANWTRAEILELDENKISTLKLLGTEAIVKNVSLYSAFVLPVNTLSSDFDWRNSLNTGDEVDYLDNKSWYRSTIIETMNKLSLGADGNDKMTKHIKVGLRVYREDGRSIDLGDHRKYFGWPSNFDKETTVHDPKLRRPNEFSKKITNYQLLTTYPIDGRKFNELDTFIPFEINSQKFYVIPRKLDGKTLDYSYYFLINTFCQEYNGLEKILDTLKEMSSSQSVNYDLFTILVDIIYSIHSFIHLKFAQTYLRDFTSLCFDILRKFSSQEIRNFKRDKFENIIKRLKEILLRVYIDVDANVIFDLFGVEFGLNCFKTSTILDKKLLGLKILTDTLGEVTKAASSAMSAEKHLSPPFVMSKVLVQDESGNNIIDILYGSQSHSQILQKSPDLLKTFFMARVLSSKDMEKLLTKAKEATDAETRDVILKGIQSNTNHLGIELQIYLVKNLMQLPLDKMTQMDMELLVSSFKAIPAYGNKDIIPVIAKYFFNVIFYQSHLLSMSMYDNIVTEWVSLMKTSEFREIVVDYIAELIKLLDDTSIDFSKIIKILKKLLTSLFYILEETKKVRLAYVLFGSSYKIEENIKVEVEATENVEIKPENSFSIVDHVVSFLVEYHSSTKQTLREREEKGDLLLDVDSFIFPMSRRNNSTSHSEIVNDVINLFSLFNGLKNFSFTDEQINLLYLVYVQDCISLRDSNLFFKWLKEAEDKKVIPQETFEKIFNKMLESKDLEFSNINLDFFNCLWNIFTTINKNSGKISANEYKGESTFAYSSVSSAGAQLLSYSFNPEKKNEFDVKCLIDNPLDLIGVELIWKLVISCANTGEVSKKANQNILKLFICNNLEPEKRGQVWDMLMEKCIATIKHIKALNQSNKIDKFEKRLKIVNCLNILKSLIEETEKKGTAGCISHSSILKNSVIDLKINNYISVKGQTLMEKNLVLKVFSNTTIWDLKKLIGNKIGVIPESIRFLSQGTKDITDNDHGKTLSELKIKSNDTLSIVKSPILEQIPRMSLMKDGKLIEKAVKAFNEIFEQFSTDGLMSKEQCAQFAFVATDSHETISPDDNRIKSVFEAHDSDRDGYLTIEGFMGFFISAIVDQKKPNIVWDNLRAFNYRNDLKKLNEPLDEYNTEIKAMPRFVLSKNQDYFNTIFELQDEDEGIAREASKFLSIICTNPIIYRDILLLKNANEWNNYIDSHNPYKLMYSLQILESFFEEFELADQKADNEALELTILEDNDRELLQPNHKLLWIEKFLTQGGITHIINNVFLNSEITSNPQFKKSLNLSLKLVKNSLSLLFRARNSKSKKDDMILLLRKESVTPEAVLNSEDEKAINDIFKDEKKKDEGEVNNKDKKEDSEKVSPEPKKNDLESELILLLSHSGETFIQDINFSALAAKLMRITHGLVAKSETDWDEKFLVNNAINLLSLIIVSQDNISSFLNNSIYNFTFTLHEDSPKAKVVTFDNFILSGLLLTNIMTRNHFQKTFKSLAQNLSNLKEHSFTFKLLEICNKKITNLTNYEKMQCKFFFELFIGLLDTCLKLQNSTEQFEINSSIDYEQLAKNIVEILKNEYNTIEEELLNGYLKILNVIISNKEDKFKTYVGVDLNMINILIEFYLIKELKFDSNQLFELNTEGDVTLIDPSSETYSQYVNVPSYSSSESRLAVFHLLLNLVTGNFDNLVKMFSIEKITQLNKYTSKLKRDKKFYNPANEKRTHGYSGLKNLRCICYMLSVLQQFFNVPTFRYAIMQSNDGKATEYSEDNKEVDDNVLHQLQKMFVHLELTNRNEYNPVDFCYAFKGLDGLPTNISLQQDAQEFLGRLFDILENSLRNTEYKYLFQSVFLGKTCSQLICKGGCGKVRNNFEDFYNLSLEVQGWKTLKSSLEKYISEDRIDDFFCETCKKKVSVVKRNSFAELPNVLIIHLQRILFNYESLMNEKINSRLEFPKQINLKEYCTENIASNEEADSEFNDRVFQKEEDYYNYELVGVVVHLGVAEAGHYYSYINVKRDGTFDKMNYDPTNEEHIRKWLTFNDSSVSSFLIRNLEEDCFGGSSASAGGASSNVGATVDDDISSSFWGPRRQGNTDLDNSKNAYMLVYERIKKSPLKLCVKDPNSVTGKSVVTHTDEDKYKILKQFNTFIKSSVDNLETVETVENPENIANASLDNTNKNDNVSLDCENTAISRRDNQEGKDINTRNLEIYQNLFHNETTNEYTYYIPFYSLNRLIPANYFYEVAQDNISFINDQKIYSSSFSEFIEKLIDNIVKMTKSSSFNTEYNREFIFKVFDSLKTYLLEIIAMSNFRDNLKSIVENLNEIVKSYPELSENVLEYITKSKEMLITDLLFSSEDSANLAYKNLIQCSLIENFKLHGNEVKLILQNYEEYNTQEKRKEMPVCIQLLDYFYTLIPVEATKSWTKVWAFVDLFDGLAKSNEELVLDYLFKKETIYRLIDFMLGKESPYYVKGEMRTEMGSKFMAPKFSALVSAVSTLVRHCYTLGWTPEDHMSEVVPHTFIKCGAKVYELTERDKECLAQKTFYKKAIKDSQSVLALSRLLAHLMFNDFHFSKKKAFLIMEAINEIIPTTEARNTFDLTFHVLLVEDKYTNYRLEWIFGIPQMGIKTSDSTSPSLYQRDSKWSERIIKYLSPINYGTNYDSLIDKILTKYQASSDFITILNFFFAMVFSKKHIFNYFDSLPHPRKDKKYLKEYLFYLGEEERNRLLNVPSMASKYEKLIKGINNIIDEYDNKRGILNAGNEEENKKKFAPQYKYGSIIREHISNVPNQNLNAHNVYLLMIEYDAEIDAEGLDLDDCFKVIPEETNVEVNIKDIKVENVTEVDNEVNLVNDEPLVDNIDLTKVTSNPNIPSDFEVEDGNDDLNCSNQAVQGYEPGKNVSVVDLTGADDDDYAYQEHKEEEKENEIINLCSESQIKADGTMITQRRNKKSNSEEKIDTYVTVTKPPTSNYNNNPNTEENYIKNNLATILDSKTYTRMFNNRINKQGNYVIESSFRRYVVFNADDTELKIRFNFSAADEFVNTYIPYSEIVIYTKKNSVSSVNTFTKEDVRLPWNDIEIDVEVEVYESYEDAVQTVKNDENKKTVKKSHSYDNLKVADSNTAIALPSGETKTDTGTTTEVTTTNSATSELFPLVCEHCDNVNYINTNNPNYTCQKCKKDVFG